MGRRGKPMDYELDDDLRTFQRAHELRKDKGRMKHIQKHARRKMDSLKRVAGPMGAFNDHDEDDE